MDLYGCTLGAYLLACKVDLEERTQTTNEPTTIEEQTPRFSAHAQKAYDNLGREYKIPVEAHPDDLVSTLERLEDRYLSIQLSGGLTLRIEEERIGGKQEYDPYASSWHGRQFPKDDEKKVGVFSESVWTLFFEWEF